MFYHRRFSHDVEALHFKVVALCALFCLSAFGPCTMTGTHNPTGYDEYGSYRTDLSSGSEDVLISDGRKKITPQSSIQKLSLKNICRHSDLFCFPSTLSGFFSDFHISEANLSGFPEVKADETQLLESMQPNSNLSRLMDSGNFRLSSGNLVSCSLELKEIENSDINDTSWRESSMDSKTSGVSQKEESIRIKTSGVNQKDDFSSLHVQISHPLLDWGQKYLHFPSLAFLTVENRHNHTVLNIFEPYSTNSQFYPCNYSEINVGPGEVASLCFVFLPKSLGLCSGHIILQTSSGGFLIQAQGFAVESPYLNYSSNGKWSNIVSLFNPSGKMLHLKEVTSWISFSSGNISYSVKSVCNLIDDNSSSEFNVKEWLEVKVGQPVMAIRPRKTWIVGSNSHEPILDLEFPFRPQKIYASFCVKLLNDLKDNLDTMILEAELGGKSRFYDLKTLSVSLNVLIPCDSNGTITVSLLVENGGPGVITVVKIRAVGENFESLGTKYVQGLMLFPHSVTQVAMVTYTPDAQMNMNCKLLVETNTSDASDLEILCSDIFSFCSSYTGNGPHVNPKTRSGNSRMPPAMEIEATEMTKADESVLGNWRSQGTENGMSVLDDDEVMFPVVHMGSHGSKWIRVMNPSDQPVIMQLLLNSGEIINECRGSSDEVLQPSSSYTLVLNRDTNPSRYGFSVSENAVTEAYVHPKGKAVLGPIIFRPSSRCAWRSSALVRNNLSGVEWLSLRGSGGLLSVLLLDRSEPVHKIELNHDFPVSYGQPSVKVMHVKNTGDLRVEVDRISVSGTKCGSDGFVVDDDTCNGFGLRPGDSRKLVVSYRSGSCSGMVRRELELVMAGGMLIVPMEVGLSTPMLTVCRRMSFWMKFKKFLLAVLVCILLILMASPSLFSFTTRGGKSNVSSNLEPETVTEMTTTTTSVSKSTVIESPKPENLTVKTGKEKTRRRKKKRAGSGLGLNTGLTGQFEGSSSHSSNSNSTPSSPLSPFSFAAPKRSPERSPKVRGAIEPKAVKPMTRIETVVPRAKAPGTERGAVKREESLGFDVRFTYNIWDDHLQVRFPIGVSSEMGSVLPTIAEDEDFSLFTFSPQELFKCHAENVSFKQDD